MNNFNYIWFIRDIIEQSDYYGDLANQQNLRFVHKKNAFGSRLLSRIFNLSYSQKINNKFRLPWKKLLLDLLWKEICPDNSNQIIFIFHQGWHDLDILSWLEKKHCNIIKVLYFNDTVACYMKGNNRLIPENLGKQYDYVLSYNPGDVRKYGFIQTNVFTSKHNIYLINKPVDYDLSFIGQAKDRLPVLKQIFNYLRENGCKCDFVVVGDVVKNEDGMVFTDKYIPYIDYILRECASNCILEILKDDTEGSTLRCWEAVYYNKKLLTNWKGVFQFPFYNPLYMRYFETIDDIDLDFLIEKIQVDYHYQDENSPMKLLEQIEFLIINSE